MRLLEIGSATGCAWAAREKESEGEGEGGREGDSSSHTTARRTCVAPHRIVSGGVLGSREMAEPSLLGVPPVIIEGPTGESSVPPAKAEVRVATPPSAALSLPSAGRPPGVNVELSPLGGVGGSRNSAEPTRCVCAWCGAATTGEVKGRLRGG